MGLATHSGTICRCYDVDEADVFTYSRELNLSEYEFFCAAARRWGISLERVQEDFKQYLWLNSLPFYVTDWVRTLRISPAPSC
jgi:hypothetical protein